VFFQVDSLQAGSVLIKLHGTAAKKDKTKRESDGPDVCPGGSGGIFVHGKDAEIKQGAPFTAFVDEDTLLSPAIRAGDSVRRRGQDCRR